MHLADQCLPFPTQQEERREQESMETRGPSEVNHRHSPPALTPRQELVHPAVLGPQLQCPVRLSASQLSVRAAVWTVHLSSLAFLHVALAYGDLEEP